MSDREETDSLQNLKEAVEKNPKDTQAYLNLGNACLKELNGSEALDAFQKGHTPAAGTMPRLTLAWLRRSMPSSGMMRCWTHSRKPAGSNRTGRKLITIWGWVIW